MPLSNKTIQNLSIALTPDVIKEIYSDSRWSDLMMEIVPEIVSEHLGSEDIDLITEISCCIMDNINLKPHQTL
jgi:hypothetical protein